MAMIDVPYLQKRGKSYRYRRTVPPDLRSDYGKGEILIPAPKGATLGEVEKHCRYWARVHDALFDQMRKGVKFDSQVVAEIERRARELLEEGDEAMRLALEQARDDAVADFHNRNPRKAKATGAKVAQVPAAVIGAALDGGKFTPTATDLRTVSKNYLASPNAPSATKQVTYAVDQWIEANGDTDFAKVRRAQVVRFVEFLRNDRGQADATIQRRINALRGVDTWLRIGLEMEPNPLPWAKLGLESGEVKSKRLPFHKSHLKLIDAYVATDKAGLATRRMLRVMKCTGLGPAEVVGIRAADVDLEASPPAVLIQPTEVRRLKGKGKKGQDTRARRLPLVGDALEAIKEAVGDPAGVTLFSKEAPRGDSVSAKLNKAIRAAGVPKSERLTSYSFRHSFSSALEATGLRQLLCDYVMGHSQNEVRDNYRPPVAKLDEIHAAMLKALDRLGDESELNYEPEELPSKR